VAEFSAPRLLRIDRRTGHASVGARLLQPAEGLAYGGGCVWATMTEDDAVARKCPRENAIPATVGRHPEHLTYARGRVYVATRFDQALVVVDPDRLQIVRRLPMPFSPFAVTSDRHHVWVTGLGENTVTRVDLA
jgi:DNA-binding beta-propeller fold protein YncE